MTDHVSPSPGKKNNVIRLSDVLNDSTMYTVEDMLHEALDRAAELGIKKGIVILWDEEAPIADQIKWHTVGMTREEHMRLLSWAKDEYFAYYMLGHTHSPSDDG